MIARASTPGVTLRDRALVFGALAALSTVQNYVWSREAAGGPRWDVSLLRALTWIAPWFLVSPLVLALSARAERGAASLSARLVRHSFAALACAPAVVVLTQWVHALGVLALHGLQEPWVQALVPSAGDVTEGVLGVPFMYATIAVVGAALRNARARHDASLQAAKLAGQLSDARLALLQRQVHPHFLFNALQAVSTLLHRDPRRADHLLVRLSGLLRVLLDDATTQEVDVRTEIEITRRYLEIEQVRFEDRLQVRWDVRPEVAALDAKTARVPSLVLLPLVENAIRHGLAPKVGSGELSISVRIDGSTLAIEVVDDGAGAGAPIREGVGLGNTRKRLSGLYGDEGTLTVVSPAGGGFIARVCLPLREARA